MLCNLASAADVVLTWDAATKRQDGTLITGTKTYRLYETVGTVAKPAITLPGDTLKHTILNVTPGQYSYQISTVEGTNEGPKSDAVSVLILSHPAKMIIFVDVAAVQ